jgi:hypothetical protein
LTESKRIDRISARYINKQSYRYPYDKLSSTTQLGKPSDPNKSSKKSHLLDELMLELIQAKTARANKAHVPQKAETPSTARSTSEREDYAPKYSFTCLFWKYSKQPIT